MNLIKRLFSGRGAVISVPYAFLLLFFLLPFFIVFKISVSEMEAVSFKDVLTLKEGVLQLTLKLSNYVFITDDALYFKTYLSSLQYAAATTLLSSMTMGTAYTLPLIIKLGATLNGNV